MTVVELARLVEQMRRAQKAYFRTRSPESLESSKALERQVDGVVREILDAQASLFREINER